jgi:hypothetical protein
MLLFEMHSISQAPERLQNNWYFIVMVTKLQFVSCLYFL